MGEPASSGPDRPLSQLLHEWRVESSLPPRFEDGVWRRIAASGGSVSISLPRYLLRQLDAWFSRPALAISYVALLLLAGLTAGSWQARRESERMDQTLSRRYVESVDPYQTPRH